MSAALEQTEFEAWRAERRRRVVTEAELQGMLGGADTAFSATCPADLVAAAKSRSNIKSDADLLLYALAKVALEDDFGWKAMQLKGSIPDDVELEFF